MDSVTQFALGATVGTAVLGRRVGARSGIIIGGLLGTLPDLDVFVPVADPVASFIGHRGATHSLIVHTLVTPLISEALVRSFAKLRNIRPLAYAAVFFCLTTHALLDAMTVYGTRLCWPIWDEPVGLGSIFIIDPLFSLPLLIVTIWAAFLHQWTVLYGRAVPCALSLSALYLGWTVIGQQIAEARGVKHLKEWGLSAKKYLPDQRRSILYSGGSSLSTDRHTITSMYLCSPIPTKSRPTSTKDGVRMFHAGPNKRHLGIVPLQCSWIFQTIFIKLHETELMLWFLTSAWATIRNSHSDLRLRHIQTALFPKRIQYASRPSANGQAIRIGSSQV